MLQIYLGRKEVDKWNKETFCERADIARNQSLVCPE